MNEQGSPWVKTINRVHLIYLGLLPALATFATLRVYGYPLKFLLFICGVAAVGIYLAVLYAYAPLPQTLLTSLWALVDGPLFALTARWGSERWLLSFAIGGFLVDGLAIWLAILWLSLVSPLPTPGQRWASITIMIAVLGAMLSLFWPYLRENVWGQWIQIAWLIVGIAEGGFVWLRLLAAAKMAREQNDENILYIALLVMAWVGAMIAGSVLYEL